MFKYCRYHQNHGHTTDECKHLKDEIEGLISRGYLRWYVRNWGDYHPRNNKNNGRQGHAPQGHARGAQALEDEDMPLPIKGEDIVTIAGGLHPAGTSQNTLKRYINELKTNEWTPYVLEPRSSKA